MLGFSVCGSGELMMLVLFFLQHVALTCCCSSMHLRLVKAPSTYLFSSHFPSLSCRLFFTSVFLCFNAPFSAASLTVSFPLLAFCLSYLMLSVTFPLFACLSFSSYHYRLFSSACLSVCLALSLYLHFFFWVDYVFRVTSYTSRLSKTLHELDDIHCEFNILGIS